MQHDKIAVVTGATKGIGRAIVQLLAAQGFSVWFCARNETEVLAFESQLRMEFRKASFWGLACDLGTAEGRELMRMSLNNSLTHVDVLVNNAGVFLPGGIMTEAPGTLETLVETNVYSAYHASRAAFPLLQKSKLPHVFNMCSTASITAYVNGGSYAITKFGLLGMSKVLREELKPFNIRVTAILPGATKTASWDGTELPDERFMKAEDVAHALWSCYAMGASTVVEEILMRPLLGDID